MIDPGAEDGDRATRRRQRTGGEERHISDDALMFAENEAVWTADGQYIHPVSIDEFRNAPAETYDVLVEPSGQDAFTIFCQDMGRTGYAAGTLAVREGLRAEVPAMDAPQLLTMADMGHGGHGGHGGNGAHDGHSAALAAAAAADPHAGHAMPNVVTVVANDYKFEAPTEIPAGLTKFVLKGAGQQIHHATIARLDDGKTVADLQAAMSRGTGVLRSAESLAATAAVLAASAVDRRAAVPFEAVLADDDARAVAVADQPRQRGAERVPV